MQRNFEDKVRQLSTTKSYAPKIVKRKPSSAEGREGDIALGLTAKGIKLYAKLGNRWYSFSSDEQALESVKDNINASIASQYSISNLTTDRTYNANSTTLGEIARILGTLIEDLDKLGFLKSKIS